MQAATPNGGDFPRHSVNLSGYPDLVVVYLGFRVAAWRGVLTLLGIGRKLVDIQRDKPDGLLANETIIYGLNHIGMRQYWRDLESLEAFTKSDPHKTWWRDFGKDPAGAGFWHEAYRKSGGMEGLYLNMAKPIGFAAFAPERAQTDVYKNSRSRLSASTTAERTAA